MHKLFCIFAYLLFLPLVLNADVPGVQERFYLENEQLMTHDGKCFAKLSFIDSMREQLAWKLKDPVLAHSICESFHAYIAPTLDPYEQEQFSTALMRVCFSITPQFEQTQRALSHALIEEGFYYQEWLERSPNALGFFWAAIHFPYAQKSSLTKKLRSAV